MTMAQQPSGLPDDAPPGERQPRRMVGSNRARAPIYERSDVVARLKLAFPLIAGVIIAMVLAWPHIMPNRHGFPIGGAKIAPQEAEQLRMTNARLVGTDQKGQPYTVTATMAEESSPSSPTVDLTEPKADITMKDGAWTMGNAKTGVFHRELKTLDLAGDVTVFQDSGAEFHTSTATIDLTTHDAIGHEPVQGQSPSGTITGQGFTITGHGQIVTFTGRSHAILRQRLGGAS